MLDLKTLTLIIKLNDFKKIELIFNNKYRIIEYNELNFKNIYKKRFSMNIIK
jgi:hypothetical protein